MRIGVDARILELPCPTGVERAAAEILRALPGALSGGDRVFVYVRKRFDLPAGPQVETRALDGPDSALLWRETHLGAAAEGDRCDVLWSPVVAVPFLCAVPSVATFHEAPWLVRRGIEGRTRETAHAIRLAVTARTAARIVCPSRASLAQFTELHPDAAPRARVVPHGVPARFFDPPPGGAAERLARLGVERPYLLQVGGNRPRKNVPLLLRAFARYRLRGGPSSLVLAGPGDPPEPAPRGVRALGWVSDDDLVALYDHASALVVASEAEGFGIPVLEAMARGCPVVALPTGGVVEAAGDAAAFVGAHTAGVDGAGVNGAGDAAEALAGVVLRIERDPLLRALLVERGRRRAAACRWADAAAALVPVLREAAART